MNRRYALILALLITIIVASDYYLIQGALNKNESPKESVFVSRVIDGDTLVLEDGRKIRLLNVNAPEKNMPHSGLAADFLRSYENRSIEIENEGMDKYGRYLARLYSPDYLNLELIKLGFSSKFLVEDSELNLFADAESDAIKNSRGIWKKSEYFSCFASEIDENAEVVTIINNCKGINVNGWYIKDESRKIYRFNNLVLGRISLNSSAGADSPTHLFWNQKTDVWNNDRDTLYLFDSSGNIVHYNAYGY